jgi:hypothetical protein
LKLAQQATLETRDAKHEPRTLTEQKAAWLTQAGEVLGGPQAVQHMVHTALHPDPVAGTPVNAQWVKDAAGRVLAAMEEHRSTWQIWHVRAEAQRQVRALELPADQSERLVDLLVSDVLGNRSVSLARPNDGITEPAGLQRSDGTSVYTVAGSELFTSTRILDAEQRLVATAVRYDGHTISPAAVDAALLQASANAVTLNAGQVALIRQMAASGARLQLAIAPAGAGKTTAMQTLAAAWTKAGGNVIGLAPSAAAAAQLRDQINAHTDTLAKLTWSAGQHDLPGWARRIGPSTLVVIDEAGMADTLSLDAAVEFIVGRGGSVRLVGDDQHWPRSAPAARSATSPTPMEWSGSPSCTGSPTPPKAPPPSPSATADPRRWASTSTNGGSMSATWPPSPRTSSLLGKSTGVAAWMRSCSPPPGNWSASSTNAPAPTGSPPNQTRPRPSPVGWRC